MSTDLLISMACVLVACVCGATCLLRRHHATGDDDWMPAELQGASLVYAERLYRAKGSVTISAKVDRAYRDRAGVVTLVELKTRDVDRVYMSDIIELWAQRFALAAQTGDVVRAQGYVLVASTARRRRTAHRVDLLTEDQVVALAARREAVLAGMIEARHACSYALCKNCAFVEPCRKTS